MQTHHFAWIAFLALAVASERGVTAPVKPLGCPLPSAGETAEDCPWAGVARELIQESESGGPLLPKFRELLPALANQIKSDSLHQDWKNLWGQSINYDEYAKGVIVNPAILKMLQEAFGVPVGERISHAGLEHTYGYLFSNLKTPYGYKRARWVKIGADEGFELKGKPLSPSPEEGTFFSNVTYFLGNIAFRDCPTELKILKTGSSRVARVLTRYPYRKLKIDRISETVEAPLKGKDRKVTLRTDLVSFTQVPSGQKNTHLLIYSIIDSANKSAQLVTAFPVEDSFVQKITAPELFGGSKPVLTRYNGYVEGLTGANLNGTRKLLRAESSE